MTARPIASTKVECFVHHLARLPLDTAATNNHSPLATAIVSCVRSREQVQSRNTILAHLIRIHAAL